MAEGVGNSKKDGEGGLVREAEQAKEDERRDTTDGLMGILLRSRRGGKRGMRGREEEKEEEEEVVEEEGEGDYQAGRDFLFFSPIPSRYWILLCTWSESERETREKKIE